MVAQRYSVFSDTQGESITAIPSDKSRSSLTIQMLQWLRSKALTFALTPLVAKLVSLQRIKTFFDSFCGDDQHLQTVSNLDVPLGGACESILDKSLDLLPR